MQPQLGRLNNSVRALTPREREVLAAISTGDTSEQIATRLGITVPTLKRHLANLYAKLGCGNRVQLSNLHHFGDRRGPVPLP